MDDQADFSRELEARLAASRRVPKWSAEQVKQFMSDFEPRRKRFEELANHLISSIVRPRLEKVACHFENAKLAKADRADRCACWFGYSNRFPATTKVEFAVEHDEAIENLVVAYELYMMPVFLKFDAHDKLTLRLDAANETAIAAWVEAKLLTFLDTYLRIDRGQDDSEDEAVVDPVCGMRISRSKVGASMDYRGHAYFFCSEDCQQRFSKEPLRYVRFETQ